MTYSINFLFTQGQFSHILECILEKAVN